MRVALVDPSGSLVHVNASVWEPFRSVDELPESGLSVAVVRGEVMDVPKVYDYPVLWASQRPAPLPSLEPFRMHWRVLPDTSEHVLVRIAEILALWRGGQLPGSFNAEGRRRRKKVCTLTFFPPGGGVCCLSTNSRDGWTELGPGNLRAAFVRRLVDEPGRAWSEKEVRMLVSESHESNTPSSAMTQCNDILGGRIEGDVRTDWTYTGARARFYQGEVVAVHDPLRPRAPRSRRTGVKSSVQRAVEDVERHRKINDIASMWELSAKVFGIVDTLLRAIDAGFIEEVLPAIAMLNHPLYVLEHYRARQILCQAAVDWLLTRPAESRQYIPALNSLIEGLGHLDARATAILGEELPRLRHLSVEWTRSQPHSPYWRVNHETEISHRRIGARAAELALPDAVALLQEGKALAFESNAEGLLVATMRDLGKTLAREGHVARALEEFTQALAIAKERGDSRRTIQVGLAVASTYLQVAESREGEDRLVWVGQGERALRDAEAEYASIRDLTRQLAQRPIIADWYQPSLRVEFSDMRARVEILRHSSRN